MEHIPVFKSEIINNLNIKPDGIYVDCTMGGAGHSLEILDRLSTGHLISIDVDKYCIDKSNKIQQKYLKKWTIVKNNFSNLEKILDDCGYKNVDGIICDLGVSSFQLDDENRGFSYHRDTELNFDMDSSQNSSKTYKFLNEESEDIISNVLKKYGDEKYSYKIARAIVKERVVNKITNTLQLVEIIKNNTPQKYQRKKHPARKTFQAIRIYVNDEITNLEKLLNVAPDLLKINGRFIIISFHSIEDRIIKKKFHDLTFQEGNKIPILNNENNKYDLIWKKAKKPTENEIISNRRSRTGKLRGIWKKKL